jgi:hypothetical protein
VLQEELLLVLQAHLNVSRGVSGGFSTGGSELCYLGHLALLQTEAGIATFGVWHCYWGTVDFFSLDVRCFYQWFEALLA